MEELLRTFKYFVPPSANSINHKTQHLGISFLGGNPVLCWTALYWPCAWVLETFSVLLCVLQMSFYLYCPKFGAQTLSPAFVYVLTTFLHWASFEKAFKLLRSWFSAAPQPFTRRLTSNKGFKYAFVSTVHVWEHMELLSVLSPPFHHKGASSPSDVRVTEEQELWWTGFWFNETVALILPGKMIWLISCFQARHFLEHVSTTVSMCTNSSEYRPLQVLVCYC